MFAQTLSTKSILLVVWLTGQLGVCFAGSPRLAFDFSRTAECRELKPDESIELYPNEKLVELKLRVSVHLLEGKIGDVEEIRIEASDCDSKMRVHSFSPNTRLASSLSQDIKWTKTTETGNSVGASLGGALPIPAGELIAQVTPTLSGGLSNREIVTEERHRVAPQRAVVASGTIKQEHGVFFKLRSSPQSSLEGLHELTIRFVVPEKWRGDSVSVCCYATGHEKVLWMKQETTWAKTVAPIAVYLAGDLEARQAAEKYVTSATL